MKTTQLLLYVILLLLIQCKGTPRKNLENSVTIITDSLAPSDSFSIQKGDTANITPPSQIISLKDNAEMVYIHYGPFLYGISEFKRDSIINKLASAHTDLFEFENPEMHISLKSYYIDKYEVTNKQYAIFLNETSYKRKPRYWSNSLYNQPNQPVVGVLWQDAAAFAKWAGKRLPTEEEWEKAARGPYGNIWPWGNEPSGRKYNGNAAGNLTPIDVGSYPDGGSYYKVMDMAGNVYEYTSDIWHDTIRVMRGGSYLNTAAYVMTTFRWGSGEPAGAEYLGFRCVMDTQFVKVNALQSSGISQRDIERRKETRSKRK